MPDLSVYDRLKGFNTLQDEAKKNALAEALSQAQIMSAIATAKKAAIPDADKLGEQAFLKAAQGMPLTPQEDAALRFLDAKAPTSAFNPVTGVMEQKPSLLDRAGLNANKQNSGAKDLYKSAQLNNAAANNEPLTPKSRQVKQEAEIKAGLEREQNYTKAQSGLVGFRQQTGVVTSTIDKAIDLAKNSRTATGWGNILTGRGLPPGDAREMGNYLDTIKANIGFDKLQQMRENSPTGGALGQVSDTENRLLQAVSGALDPLQETQLIQNLTTIKNLYPQVLAERERAFEQDYGAFKPLGNNPQPIPKNQPVPTNLYQKSKNKFDSGKWNTTPNGNKYRIVD